MLKKRISVYSKMIFFNKGKKHVKKLINVETLFIFLSTFSEVLSWNVPKQGFMCVGYAFDLPNFLEGQLRVKDPFKHLTWDVLTKLWLKLFLFLWNKFILDVWLGPEYASDLFSPIIFLIYLHVWNRTLLELYIHKYCKILPRH